MENFEDIVLYHGSLEELNSRNPEKQYRIAEEDFFITDFEELGFIHQDPYQSIKKQIQKKDYIGLVNARSIIRIESNFGGAHMRFFGMEGTPIIRALD